jgi:hypothetical protein
MRLLPVLLFTACMAAPVAPTTPVSEAAQEAEQPVLRTYELPEGAAARVRPLLERLLVRGASLGRVEEGLSGEVVVIAAPSLQEGVAEIVARAQTVPPAAVTTRNVRMDYWLVRAWPAEETTKGPGLAAVDKSLARIVEQDGPLDFELSAHESLLSTNDGRAELSNSATELSQITAIDTSDVVHAMLDVGSRYGPKLSTEVRLAAGQQLVIAQGSWSGPRTESDANRGPSALYIIVQPTVTEAR